MPKISIIVPVYNRERTLPFCIDGILNSEKKDFELLLIDDGSTDNSLKICREYEQRDNRIRVISKTNGGVSSARNLGLDNVRGEWILFVDSDDSIFPDCLNILESNDNQFINFIKFESACAKYNDRKLYQLGEKKSVKNLLFENNETVINYIFGDFCPYQKSFYNLWDKFFKTTVINEYNIRFKTDVTLGEDQIFVCEYLKYVTGMVHTFNLGRAEVVWDVNFRTYSLGSKLRTPEDFFHCQMENYKALVELYEHTKNTAVKEYADNYIIDRPITRILFRYSTLNNRMKYSFFKLKSFFDKSVISYFREINPDENAVKNKKVRKIYKLLIHDKFSAAYRCAFLFETYSTLLSGLKHCMHNFYTLLIKKSNPYITF